jgi:ABC-type glycerol-3-phosphate transport system substrate-binding protein
MIQPQGAKEPAAEPTFFQSLLHEVKGFFQSFVRDYNNMGALVETDEGSTEVWMASARDQFLIVRNLINNDFTPNTNTPINLKLVAGGTLLPSILSGSGPDVYLGLGSGDVINYAIRSALLSIEHFEDFESYTKANYNEAAMIVLGMEDADEQMHYYGLPEMQSFSMMFVRIDILADLGLEVPKTWEDIMSCIPTLQANNMQIGFPTDFQIFLYQQGGELFADEGMRINMDSKVGLASFEKMCNMFTMYSFPYQYDGANRFRTGEMPIIIGDYTGFYNQLKVFATEINGKWEFMPMPGETQADGSINNVAVSGVSATVMVKGCDQQAKSWEFMKWYNGANFQVEFTNEMVAIMGPSAKQAVSNKNALASLPWTTAEYQQIQLQFNNLASIPNYPGAYIIARYTSFAFQNAYNDNVNPSDAMLEYIPTINKEIERKRNEFNLETLTEDGVAYKDLLTKRLAQLEALVGMIRENSQFKAEYENLMKQVDRAIRSDDRLELEAASAAVKALYEQLDPTGELFLADRTEVMGYDMTDTSLTKAQKKKIRNCFSYEVYKNTDKLYTQLKCMVTFLDDAANLIGG